MECYLFRQKITFALNLNRTRTLYPAQEFWDILQIWLTQREKMGCKHDYLFAQAVHKRVAYEGLRQILAEARGLAVLSEELTAHTLRHCFACRMHSAGATIQEVQAALGHRNAHTTFLYLRLHEGDTTAMRRLGGRTQARAADDATPIPNKSAAKTLVQVPIVATNPTQLTTVPRERDRNTRAAYQSQRRRTPAK